MSIAGLSVPRVMKGRGDGVAKIARLVSRDHAIQVGAAVYAQAKRGLLDVPVIVAEVAQCKPDVDYPKVLGYHRPARLRVWRTLSDVVVLKAAP